MSDATRTLEAVAGPARARRRSGNRSLERSNISDADLGRRGVRFGYRFVMTVAIAALTIISAAVGLELLVVLFAYALCASAAAGDRRPKLPSREASVAPLLRVPRRPSPTRD